MPVTEAAPPLRPSRSLRRSPRHRLAVSGSYTIVSGDTLSGIASKFGITTEALMAANGLDWSSVIYTGGTLFIPGVSTPA